MEKLLENITNCRSFLKNPEKEEIDFDLLSNTLEQAEEELKRTGELTDRLKSFRETMKNDIIGKTEMLEKNINIEEMNDNELLKLKEDIDKDFDQKFRIVQGLSVEENEIKEPEKFKI